MFVPYQVAVKDPLQRIFLARRAEQAEMQEDAAALMDSVHKSVERRTKNLQKYTDSLQKLRAKQND